METREEIDARLRLEHPEIAVVENKVRRVLDPAAYEVRLAQWVDAELARQGREDEDEARRQLRRQVRLALTTLNDNIALLSGTPTAAQVRGCVLDNARVLRGLISVLIDLALIEREG